MYSLDKKGRKSTRHWRWGMSKERELLKKILATGWLNNTISCEVEKLLAQPEPFKPDWDNYKQGVADSKREPLSEKEIREGNESMLNVTRETFIKGVRFAEVMHGIEVGE